MAKTLAQQWAEEEAKNPRKKSAPQSEDLSNVSIGILFGLLLPGVLFILATALDQNLAHYLQRVRHYPLLPLTLYYRTILGYIFLGGGWPLALLVLFKASSRQEKLSAVTYMATTVFIEFILMAIT